MTFLANNNGKPARSVAFAAVATYFVMQVMAPALEGQGITLSGESQVLAVGVALYLVERAYRAARRWSWFGALDPWSSES